MTDFPKMKGNAAMARGASYFEVPIFSQVTDYLWTGCSPAEFPDEMEEFDYDMNRLPVGVPFDMQFPIRCHWLEPMKFDAILNLYPWVKYVVPEGAEYREAELYDSGDEPDARQILNLAGWVHDHLQRQNKILVHCQAGLNRSALVAAVALAMGGMPGGMAIDLIREKRSPMCLCNETFETWLRRLDPVIVRG